MGFSVSIVVFYAGDSLRSRAGENIGREYGCAWTASWLRESPCDAAKGSTLFVGKKFAATSYAHSRCVVNTQNYVVLRDFQQ
jgi:hypothetical protein